METAIPKTFNNQWISFINSDIFAIFHQTFILSNFSKLLHDALRYLELISVGIFFLRHASGMPSRIPGRRSDPAAGQERSWQTNAPRQPGVTPFRSWDGEAYEKGDETGRRAVKSAEVEREGSDHGRAAEDRVGGRGAGWKVEDRENRAQVDKGHVSRHPSTQPFIDYSRTMGVTSGAVAGPRWRIGSAIDPSFILGMTLEWLSTPLIYRHKIGNLPWYDFFSSFVANNYRKWRSNLRESGTEFSQECEMKIARNSVTKQSMCLILFFLIKSNVFTILHSVKFSR